MIWLTCSFSRDELEGMNLMKRKIVWNQCCIRTTKLNLLPTLAWPGLQPQIPKCKCAQPVLNNCIFWHHIKAVHQWPMKFTNYLRSSSQLSSFPPLACVRRQHLTVLCLCFQVSNITGKTLNCMHNHTSTAQPLNMVETTLGYSFPTTHRGSMTAKPCCSALIEKGGCTTSRESSLRLAPWSATDR